MVFIRWKLESMKNVFWFLLFDLQGFFGCPLISPLLKGKKKEKTFVIFMRFIFDFHCLKYQKEIMMNSWQGWVALSIKTEGKFVTEKVSEPWENRKMRKESFHINVIFILFPFFSSAFSSSSFFYDSSIYLQSTVCADDLEEKGQVFWYLAKKPTRKRRRRTRDGKELFRHFLSRRPHSNHWMKHICHDCCVFFVLWIHEQYIKLGSLKAKRSICPKCVWWAKHSAHTFP